MGKENCHAWDHHRWKSVQIGVASDIQRYLTRSEEESARGHGFARRLSAWLTPELMCLTLYRVSHFFYARGWALFARLLSNLNFLLHKVRLPAASCIGPGCRLSHPAGVVFEGTAGSNLTIFSYVICMVGDQSGTQLGGSPKIGDQVTLGGHAVLSGDISIGDAVRIAPGAVICSNISSNVIVASRSMYTSTHLETQK